mmetsp:Transcript_3275/g.3252  ORF Transcript_3275/g.3252 Transcript_3275/m.3252 type:complete len:119 (+) Transcript_3275:335-691(+)
MKEEGADSKEIEKKVKQRIQKAMLKESLKGRQGMKFYRQNQKLLSSYCQGEPSNSFMNQRSQTVGRRRLQAFTMKTGDEEEEDEESSEMNNSLRFGTDNSQQYMTTNQEFFKPKAFDP